MTRTTNRAGLLVALAAVPALALAEPGVPGDHGGGGAGCGDVFGDLVHVLRDPVTGQTILQQRWIEMPGDVYGWSQCPVAVDADGNEIPFLPLTCDPADPEAVVEVDYFGRLSGGRTKERNQRMHFDEVISTIKMAERVSTDQAGRLRFGFDCVPGNGEGAACSTWMTSDSPMENMGLYVRVMKYGHLQTDPMELDIWAHGDPASMPQYHPALGPEDYGKFDPELMFLLPGDPDFGPQCYAGAPGEETFDPQCAMAERLHTRDFERAASFLAAASGKTGIITADLVQYMHRILKVTLDTETTVSTVDTLPALVRVCETEAPPEPGVEPVYLDDCEIVEGDATLPFPASERFVDYKAVKYERSKTHATLLHVLQPGEPGGWQEVDVSTLTWLGYVHGADTGKVTDLPGFVSATSDALRTIEFIHNYEVPADLWAVYATP